MSQGVSGLSKNSRNQDQALYALTSFRGAKMCVIGKKGVFLVK